MVFRRRDTIVYAVAAAAVVALGGCHQSQDTSEAKVPKASVANRQPSAKPGVTSFPPGMKLGPDGQPIRQGN